MEKKLSVMEAAKLLGVSKEAIYNRVRRGTLGVVVEDGVKYILLPKNSNTKESVRTKTHDGAHSMEYIDLLKAQLEELKAKNERLESDKERLIADKERLLIESKEKIEAIYKERDEQLKAILALANKQIAYVPTVTEPSLQTATEEGLYEEADVLEEEMETKEEEEAIKRYSDWRDLRSYLKEKGFSKKEREGVDEALGKKIGYSGEMFTKHGKLYIKKGKKFKEISGE